MVGTPEPEVVFSDEWVAVVDKPAGLVVHPAPGHRSRTLVDLLPGLAGGAAERPGIVHRLDKDTSGLMAVARSEEAHRDLAAQVRGRTVERVYLALVEGHLESRTGTIDAPVGRDHRAPERMTIGGRGAREARTHFTVVEALPEDSLVEARLETGRTHQIRAHFAAIGHPLAGDPTYGSGESYGLERQFLHAHRLVLTHPVSGERIEFRSELPADLAAALGAARAS
jgi:23S rRNA pseudouridine1911/1915/1917 synthase